MSYILDALKKAERERGIAQVPTLMTVHDSRIREPRRRWWAISAVSILLVALAAGLVFFWIKDASGPEPSQSGAETGQQALLVQESSPVESPPPPTATSIPFETSAVAAGTRSAAAPPAEAEARRSAPAASRASVPRQVKEQPDAATVTGGPRPQAQLANPGPEADDTAPKPISLREAVAGMKMTLLSYSEDKSERMVFIDGRKYVEGDYVDGKFLLERITAAGAVLSYQEEQALLRTK